MAQIKVTRSTRIRSDAGAAAKAAATAILAHMAKRAAQSVDVDDRPFAQYSDLYLQQLTAMGRPTSPGPRMKALLRGLKVSRVTVTAGRAVVQFDVGNTQVPSTPRPPPWVFDRSKTPTQRAAALSRWRSAPKRTRSHSASLVLRMLASGPQGTSPRRLVGISPRGRAEVIAAIEKAPVFRAG